MLTDFGVAHVTGLETMTATGALVGSPAYMSPEQARGHDVGPASDLWALGVLLYEMATGALPFPGKDPLTVIAAIARGTFKRPSQVSRVGGGDLRRASCMRCLQPDAGRALPQRPRPGRRAAHASAGDAGLGDERRRCAGSWTIPTVFEAELRPRAADAAVAAARQHVRRGELGPRADRGRPRHRVRARGTRARRHADARSRRGDGG